MRAMRIVLVATVTFAVALVASARSDAATITFGTGATTLLTGSTTEGPFTYQVISGVEWGISDAFGNPASALSTSPVEPPAVGDRVDFFLTGGGTFTFDSYDLGTLFATQSATVDFFGVLNNVVLYQILGVGTSSTTFVTAAGFGGPIDTLRVVVATLGQTDLGLDNLVLTEVSEVPEPATLLLLGTGLGAVAARRRLKKRA